MDVFNKIPQVETLHDIEMIQVPITAKCNWQTMKYQFKKKEHLRTNIEIGH